MGLLRFTNYRADYELLSGLRITAPDYELIMDYGGGIVNTAA